MIDKLSNNSQNQKVLKLKELNREEAIEVFKRYEQDNDKIKY